ncbi:MAG: hypothetical protein ACI9BH_001562, partial [Paracoccaceae bacterium]
MPRRWALTVTVRATCLDHIRVVFLEDVNNPA